MVVMGEQASFCRRPYLISYCTVAPPPAQQQLKKTFVG